MIEKIPLSIRGFSIKNFQEIFPEFKIRFNLYYLYSYQWCHSIDYFHIIYSRFAVLLFVSYHSLKPLIKISALEPMSEQRIRWSVWRNKQSIYSTEFAYKSKSIKANTKNIIFLLSKNWNFWRTRLRITIVNSLFIPFNRRDRNIINYLSISGNNLVNSESIEILLIVRKYCIEILCIRGSTLYTVWVINKFNARALL